MGPLVDLKHLRKESETMNIGQNKLPFRIQMKGTPGWHSRLNICLTLDLSSDQDLTLGCFFECFLESIQSSFVF